MDEILISQEVKEVLEIAIEKAVKEVIKKSEEKIKQQAALEIAEKMLLNGESIANIINYINLTEEQIKNLQKDFSFSDTLNMEVSTTMRTLINDSTIKETEKRIANKMLSNNEPLNKIMDYTGLLEKEIKGIQKTL